MSRSAMSPKRTEFYDSFHAMRPGVTIAHIRASQPTLHPERVEPIFAGLRAAGMPEGEPAWRLTMRIAGEMSSKPRALRLFAAPFPG